MPQLSQTEQDILILFSFWSLLVFTTGALASLIVKSLQFLTSRKSLNQKCLDREH